MMSTMLQKEIPVIAVIVDDLASPFLLGKKLCLYLHARHEHRAATE